jgi:hypothetical protein
LSDPAANLVRRFPRLAESGFRITSEATPHYNCLAWAVHETGRWISPELYDARLSLYPWPAGVAREDTLDAWMDALATFGFAPCETGILEPSTEKLALYAMDAIVRHVARQLPSGRWTSKLGRWEDIEHDLHALEGERYGTVERFMKRERPVALPARSA